MTIGRSILLSVSLPLSLPLPLLTSDLMYLSRLCIYGLYLYSAGHYSEGEWLDDTKRLSDYDTSLKVKKHPSPLLTHSNYLSKEGCAAPASAAPCDCVRHRCARPPHAVLRPRSANQRCNGRDLARTACS